MENLNLHREKMEELGDEREYLKQAEYFLGLTNSTLTIEFLKNDYHFLDDKDKRDIYECTLKRNNRSYAFNFGNSIASSQKKKTPNAYDVLTCLEKYDNDNFENFCNNYGFDIDSRKAKKVWLAVDKEYKALQTLYSDAELELMQLIQ
jgi:hypothetical protein